MSLVYYFLEQGVYVSCNCYHSLVNRDVYNAFLDILRGHRHEDRYENNLLGNIIHIKLRCRLRDYVHQIYFAEQKNTIIHRRPIVRCVFKVHLRVKTIISLHEILAHTAYANPNVTCGPSTNDAACIALVVKVCNNNLRVSKDEQLLHLVILVHNSLQHFLINSFTFQYFSYSNYITLAVNYCKAITHMTSMSILTNFPCPTHILRKRTWATERLHIRPIASF